MQHNKEPNELVSSVVIEDLNIKIMLEKKLGDGKKSKKKFNKVLNLEFYQKSLPTKWKKLVGNFLVNSKHYLNVLLLW